MNNTYENRESVTAKLEPYAARLSDALNIASDNFAASATEYYKRTHWQGLELTRERQITAERVIAAWLPHSGEIFRPDPNLLLEGTAYFAAKAAIETGRRMPILRTHLEYWWGQMATAIVGAEKRTERTIFDENAQKKKIIIVEGLSTSGNVSSARKTRDQVISIYGNLLNLLDPPPASYLLPDQMCRKI